MRIGVFGGTFDPIHFGHLILVEQCLEQGRLDRVIVVPSARPPHKMGKQFAQFEYRADMLRLAFAGRSEFTIDEREAARDGPSFTVETVNELHEIHSDDQLCLIVGADMLSDFPKWRQPQQIAQLAQLLIVARPGYSLPPLAEMEERLDMPTNSCFNAAIVESPLIELSSTDIRRRIAENRSIRYLTPRAVEAYIQEKQLYQTVED